MRDNINEIIKKVYETVFQEKITTTVKIFFQNLTYVVLGYGIAAVCIFIFQILIGRALGPQEYGKYALIDSSAAFLSIFMTFGVSTAAIKYNAEEENYIRQKKIISSSYFVTLIISFVFTLFLLLFSNTLSKTFSLSSLTFITAVIFSICYVLYLLAIDSLSGLHQMKKIAIFRALYGFLVLAFFTVFLFKNSISLVIVCLIVSIAYLLIFLLITFNIRHYISFDVDKTWLINLLEYGLYAISGSFLIIFLPNLSKIMVFRFSTLFDVGIYNAYYFSSLSVVMLFNTIFITVFFPTASKYSKKSSIVEKINKTIPILFIFGVPILFIIQFIVLRFFGKQYSIDYWLMLLFAISGIMFFLYSIYVWLFYSKGIIQARRIVFLTVFILILNILLNFYLIPVFLLKGAVTSLIITYFFGWLYLFFKRDSLINHGKLLH